MTYGVEISSVAEAEADSAFLRLVLVEQRKVAIDIIRAGKENSADEIEITMSQKAGVGLSSDVDGVPIEFIIGASGTIKLKVKYK
jgi:hypothetical protein